MLEELSYTLLSVALISLISLIGVFTLSLNEKFLKKVLLYLVSFSAGALFGDTFIHLLPEIMEQSKFTLHISLVILLGIVFSFVIEKILQWRHCHIPTSKEHAHSFAYMNLLGDSVHNFIDGLIIGGSYVANIQVGIATTFAVILHEVPQEIGDFGVLLHGGLNRTKAILLNFLTSLFAITGAIIALSVGLSSQNFTLFILPFAVGNFIYIAGSDLIPELHKEEPELIKSILQLATFILGIIVILSIMLLA